VTGYSHAEWHKMIKIRLPYTGAEPDTGVCSTKQSVGIKVGGF